ncbi:MAG: low molecular weight protein arginine phosphatase [Armatimonadetes bacterium]|nr:low molecular weight protein arginine phosphatase [Armatimonadota bacterium]
MAEYLLRDMLKRRGSGPDPFSISSAGLYALDGQQAAPEAVATLRERGVDLAPHRSRRLSGEMVEETDLLLTMTRRQKTEVERKWPEASPRKVFTLKEYVTGEPSDPEERRSGKKSWEEEEERYDILDPYGAVQVTYDSCAREIEELMRKLASLLEREEKR